MKRIAISLFCMFCVGSIYSQQYKLEARTYFNGSGDGVRYSLLSPKITTTNGKTFYLSTIELKEVRGSSTAKYDYWTFDVSTDGYIDKMDVPISYEEHRTIGIASWWRTECETTISFGISNGLYNAYLSNGCIISLDVLNRYTNACSDRIGFTQFDYYPVLDIYNNSGDNILPDDDAIEIRTTDNRFSDNVYKWQYGVLDSIYEFVLFSGYQWRYFYNWYDVPSAYYTKDRLLVSGRQLFGNAVENYYKKNIAFRIDFGCGLSSTVLNFTVQRIAPHILDVSYEKETCYHANDAKITITFDRKLTAKERLYITFGNEIRESEKVVINSTNKAVISNVKPGKYNIGLIGVYERTPTDTTYLYTESNEHKKNNFIVEGREPLAATMTPSAVHCRSGEDGKISLTVAGGKSPYTATLLKGTNTIDERTFGSSYTFNNLDSSVYIVRVKDANGCVNDASEQPLIRNITVTEPLDSTKIFLIGSREATGYGRATGWAEVGALGSSGGYAFEWEKQTPPTAMTATSGTTNTSRLENLRTDWYLAFVKDQNYAQASPATEINRRGCYDTMYIFIDQPSKIITEVRETHIVTCHGDNDGQITVHTTGGRPFLPTQNGGLPYNYQWYKVENGTDLPIGTNDSILSNLYSGYYKVMVSDSNRVDTISQVVHLVQPDPLIATTTVLQSVLCDGDSTGKAQVTVTGGTAPYTYQWTTDNNDTTSIVENLPRNIYTVFVKDSRFRNEAAHKRCTAQAYANIKSPNGLNVDAALVNPTCSGYTDGAITLNITGGAVPYRILWENGEMANTRTNLGNGTYKVRITDANDCYITEEYTLTEPSPVVVDLGGDFTLCAEQQLTIKDKNTHENAFYEWTNGETEPELLVDKAGTYRLTVTTPEGCTGTDVITVEQSDDVLHTDFVIASLIPRGKNIHAVNIIKTSVDSVEWILPDAAVVFEKNDDDVAMSFFQNGEYTIGLTGYLGKCRDILYKTVKVVEPSEIEAYTDEEPFLKRFMVLPNPNDGNFSVNVELREVANYSLLLYNENGNLLETKEIKNKLAEETAFTRQDLGAGVYYLRFVSKEHNSTFKVIIR